MASRLLSIIASVVRKILLSLVHLGLLVAEGVALEPPKPHWYGHGGPTLPDID